MLVAKFLRTSLPLVLLIVILSSYLYMGMTGSFTGAQADQIITVANQIAGPDRAQSLEFRLDNEEILGEKARQRFIFGWGGYGRNRVFDYNWAGELVDITVTDSLWIIAFGINGAIGLVSIFGSPLIGSFSFLWLRYPAQVWLNPRVAPAAMLATISVLYMLDCSLNNQPNPVFTVASGGVAGLVMSPPEKKKKRLVQPGKVANALPSSRVRV
jgi:hypothetical protein